MLVSEFDFNLPKDLIATEPAVPKDSAKLLDASSAFKDRIIKDFPTLLNSNDVLVFNDTKVIPARISGFRDDAKIEVTLHKQISDGVWKAFAKPAKKLKVGDKFVISPKFFANVIAKNFGEVDLEFNKLGEKFFQLLNQYGSPPLPPYIDRKDGLRPEDNNNYQTVYAKNRGAVAAPTAGLHFTDQLLEQIDNIGVKRVFVTLHVGAGTFLPVKVDDTKDHLMHSEYCILSKQSADVINNARAKGGRVIAVGTTSMRLLESAADDNGMLNTFEGDTDIFITPGYKFKIVDAMLTNFHLPKSTLFMLVSAFAGFNKMHDMYKHAIKNKYRFYSYGDACFLVKS